jgi:hypothetical protein
VLSSPLSLGGFAALPVEVQVEASSLLEEMVMGVLVSSQRLLCRIWSRGLNRGSLGQEPRGGVYSGPLLIDSVYRMPD